MHKQTCNHEVDRCTLQGTFNILIPGCLDQKKIHWLLGVSYSYLNLLQNLHTQKGNCHGMKTSITSNMNANCRKHI